MASSEPGHSASEAVNGLCQYWPGRGSWPLYPPLYSALQNERIENRSLRSGLSRPVLARGPGPAGLTNDCRYPAYVICAARVKVCKAAFR